ncbi:alpha-amylase [Zhengella mangrovi]|uniref:Alpha-amylase n=1 Tax=Zhengella mangrovi TaxID=1982044 RepID=A0A2G1QQ20_9HYPH|nr:sugar phosphorylase [Zhengella mangrovi]PHP67613.1 alpha-amylase [Zhengella mangrovi]
MPFPDRLRSRLEAHLEFIYPQADHAALTEAVLDAFWPGDRDDLCRPMRRRLNAPVWSESDAVLITYGNTLVDGENTPLTLLDDFLTHHLGSAINSVHVLPFFPWTSDDGFAVVDYTKVNGDVGDWHHLTGISGHHKLMADLVLNHVSSLHPWFIQYRQDQEPGRAYFIEVDPATDLSQVVRPRPQSLLREVETAHGVKNVWCTFSHDQVDLDFSNPDLLLEFIRILRLFLDKGITTIRLDAVAFIWKEIGTTCIHLPQTHEIIRLMRTLADYSREPMVLITETNVPNRENLSYFGNRNEAHGIYNFPLPPLALHALLTGDASVLTRWQRRMPPSPAGSFYFNFTASHDGIGVRAAEGFLTDDQLNRMIEAIRGIGGLVSMRAMPDGSVRPYEINVSLWDAMLAGPGGAEMRFERFMASQTIMMALEGIPGIYIHSLLATPNDLDRVERTGHNRSINRHQWNYPELEERLSDPQSDTARVYGEMLRRLAVRTRQRAFHPNATQMTMDFGPGIFAIWRQSGDRTQSIFAIHNVTAREQVVPLDRINLIENEPWVDLLSGEPVEEPHGEIVLAPYQCRWISNVLPEL